MIYKALQRALLVPALALPGCFQPHTDYYKDRFQYEIGAIDWSTFHDRLQTRRDRTLLDKLEEQGYPNIDQHRREQYTWAIVMVDMQPGFLYRINPEMPYPGFEYQLEHWDSIWSNNYKAALEASVEPLQRQKMIAAQKKVLEDAAQYDVPVIVFEMGSGFEQTLPELDILIAPRQNTLYFDKKENGGFSSWELRYTRNSDGPIFSPSNFVDRGPASWLKEQGVNALYFMGVNTNACVYETAQEAHDLGFTIATTTDVVASTKCTGLCPAVAPALTYFKDNGILGTNADEFVDRFLRR